MKKPQIFGQLVIAGRMTHYELNGVLLCGCRDPVMADEVDPFCIKLGGKNGRAKYLMPLCMACVAKNTERWEREK